ncbi:hypothetical protein CDD82_3468 [Ophiocordyceps australis]|uniref:Peptidase S54 rhomboid domain-containing protein n=1 Tax=Ophiocordyceps australis TaxID=1399860 RepID=A0A2C5ZDP7_9HYPO|nr:hypothetical protein CDD82_3468 [Ophiocordyceps australis]
MTFTNAPVSRLAVLGLVSASIAASMLDMKHYFYIVIDAHLWRYRQFWRLLAYQLCCTNSADALFAAMTLYNLRAIERLWGPRKYASFLAVSSLLTAVIPPFIMTILRPLSASLFNYMPAGPTPLIFAALAQFYAMVPHMYKYRIATSPLDEPFSGVTFSDKSYQYLIALHLALLQWPGSVVGAAVGWVVGHAWRGGVFPTALVAWRVPAWMVGMSASKRSAEFEGLRRRLESDNGASAVSSALQSHGQGSQRSDRRRTMGQQIVDQFREAL